MSGILAAMRDSFFSTDGGGISGAHANDKSQAIAFFDEDPVSGIRRIHEHDTVIP
jgi:hypothetical protein